MGLGHDIGGEKTEIACGVSIGIQRTVDELLELIATELAAGYQRIKIKIKPVLNIQNIVASGSVGMVLNLNSLAMKLENTEYEPEQFPGLVYKLKTIYISCF